MKAVISTTYEDKYLFFLPIVTWCWNKLGVDVICFMPQKATHEENKRIQLIKDIESGWGNNKAHPFNCPEHKQATYAQCSRLFAAAIKEIPDDEVLVTSDIDMAFFSKNKVLEWENLYVYPVIYGCDLVPYGQYPMCYAAMRAKEWRIITKCENKTYQQCLDEELGNLEAEHFRGNFWSRDQELLYNKLQNTFQVSYPAPIPKMLQKRARPGTQFASNRYDRDDAYLLDRLSPDTIDYHMPRPGYEENGFNQILTVLKYHYPDDNFDWLIDYRNKYVELL